MNIQEIEDRAGGLTQISTTHLAEELGTTENTVGRLIKMAGQNGIDTELVRWNGVFSVQGAELVRRLWKIGDNEDLKGIALGAERRRYLAGTASDPVFKPLHRNYRYVPADDVFTAEVVEDADLPVDTGFQGAMVRFNAGIQHYQATSVTENLLDGVTETIEDRLGQALEALAFSATYQVASAALSRGSKRAISAALADQEAGLGVALDAQRQA